MKSYEMTYIVRPDLDEDGVRGVSEQVATRLEAAGADIVATLPWNPPRRRMAYPINEFGDGFYITTVFHLDPAALGPIENALKLNDRVLRFLLVQASDLNIKQAQQRLQQQVARQQAAAAPPAPTPPVPLAEPAATETDVATGLTAAPEGDGTEVGSAVETEPAEMPEVEAEDSGTAIEDSREAVTAATGAAGETPSLEAEE